MTPEEYERHIESVVAQAPPLTAAQIAKLTALFDYEPDGEPQ